MRALWVVVLACSMGCSDDFILPTEEIDATGVLDLTGSAAAGEAVFDEHCLFCHDKAGEVDGAGPALNGVFDRISEADSVTVIQAGRGAMPGIDITDQETADVLAFMKANYAESTADTDPPDTDPPDTDPPDTDPPDTDPPGPDGQALYEASCVGCHKEDNSGFGPSMASIAAEQTEDSDLANAIVNGTAYGMPAFPNFSTEEVDAIVAHIRATF